VVGHVGQTRENIFQVSVRIEAAPPAAFEDGVDDGAALASLGVADKELVFLADGRGANGVFHQVVVDLHPAIRQINRQRVPQAQ
jgi:hypothetical protein